MDKEYIVLLMVVIGLCLIFLAVGYYLGAIDNNLCIEKINNITQNYYLLPKG